MVILVAFNGKDSKWFPGFRDTMDNLSDDSCQAHFTSNSIFNILQIREFIVGESVYFKFELIERMT